MTRGRAAAIGLLAALVAVPWPRSEITASANLATNTTSWSHYRGVTVTNPGPAKSAHAVKVTLTGANFNFGVSQSDGEDLRVKDSDNVTDLPFWIESWDAATANAVVWVKIPSLGSQASKKIFLRYGNPQAKSASDIGQTFLFGDDFSTPQSIAGSIATSTPTFGNIDGYAGTAFDRGPAGSWDAAQVTEPSQVWYRPDAPAAERYGVLYAGHDLPSGFASHLGVAFSPDGVNFTKFVGNPVIDFGEDAYVATTTSGHLFRDTKGRYHVFTEEKFARNSPPQRGINHYTTTDFKNYTADPSNPVLRPAAAGAWDDRDVSSPVVLVDPDDDNRMYLVYEGRSMTGNNGALGLAASTNLGSTWTRSGATGELLNPSSGYTGDELVPDDVVQVNGTWYFVVHGSDAPGANQPSLFTTTAGPDAWMGSSFKQVGDDPLDASFHSTPAIADGFQLVYGPNGPQPGRVLAEGYIADLIGGGKGQWRGVRSHNNNRSDSWGTFKSNISVRDGELRLDPADSNLTPGLQFALVMSTSDLRLKSDFLVALRRKVTPQTAEGLANIHVGYGGTANRVNRHVGAFNNGYSIVITPDRVPHLWEYANSAYTGEDAVGSALTADENRKYAIHEWSYRSDGTQVYRLNGIHRLTAVDATHLSTPKELALSEGNKQSVLEGGKSSIDWVYVRRYDGAEMIASVGAELSTG